MEWISVEDKLPAVAGFYNVLLDTYNGTISHSCWFEQYKWKYDNFLAPGEPLYSSSFYASVMILNKDKNFKMKKWNFLFEDDCLFLKLFCLLIFGTWLLAYIVIQHLTIITFIVYLIAQIILSWTIGSVMLSQYKNREKPYKFEDNYDIVDGVEIYEE